MKPDEFWLLTLTEFKDLLDGYIWREEHEWQRTAQLAAWVMSPHYKKPIAADKLYKNGSKKNKKVISIEDKRRELEELEAELSF